MIHSVPTGPEPTRITRSAASMASPCASSERYPAGDTTAQRGKGGLRGCRAASTGGAPFDQGRRAACSTCAGRPGGRTGRRQWPGRHAASAHGTVQRRPHLSDALGARGCAGFAATRGSGGRRRRRQQCEQQGSCEGRRAARGGGAARGGAAHRLPRGARGSSAVFVLEQPLMCLHPLRERYHAGRPLPSLRTRPHFKTGSVPKLSLA